MPPGKNLSKSGLFSKALRAGNDDKFGANKLV